MFSLQQKTKDIWDRLVLGEQTFCHFLPAFTRPHLCLWRPITPLFLVPKCPPAGRPSTSAFGRGCNPGGDPSIQIYEPSPRRNAPPLSPGAGARAIATAPSSTHLETSSGPHFPLPQRSISFDPPVPSLPQGSTLTTSSWPGISSIASQTQTTYYLGQGSQGQGSLPSFGPHPISTACVATPNNCGNGSNGGAVNGGGGGMPPRHPRSPSPTPGSLSMRRSPSRRAHPLSSLPLSPTLRGMPRSASMPASPAQCLQLQLQLNARQIDGSGSSGGGGSAASPLLTFIKQCSGSQSSSSLCGGGSMVMNGPAQHISTFSGYPSRPRSRNGRSDRNERNDRNDRNDGLTDAGSFEDSDEVWMRAGGWSKIMI